MYAERTEQQKRIDKLAQDVLQLSRNTLLVNLRFLDAALAQLKPLVLDTVSLATDGEYLAYAPKHILCRYKEEKETSVRDWKSLKCLRILNRSRLRITGRYRADTGNGHVVRVNLFNQSVDLLFEGIDFFGEELMQCKQAV